ncbi:MAG: hypothetical protein HY897_20435 [Deltaproteobacteria bacterium]|nr:hypothetical protein [Deltaproteobacteria bacterium]
MCIDYFCVDETDLLIAGGVAAVLVFAVVAIIVVLAKKKGGGRKTQIREWQKYAAENHLTLSGEFPMFQLEGANHGINVRFWQVEQELDAGDGESPPEVEIIGEAAVSIPVPVGQLAVAREGFLEKIGKSLGGEDVKVGDPQFDTAFIVKGVNPTRVLRVLTVPVRLALLGAQRSHPDIEIDDGMVRVRTAGPVTDVATVDHTLQTLMAVAASFTKDA